MDIEFLLGILENCLKMLCPNLHDKKRGMYLAENAADCSELDRGPRGQCLCPRELLLGCEERRMDEPIGSSPVSFSKRLQPHQWEEMKGYRMDGTHKFEAIAPFGGHTTAARPRVASRALANPIFAYSAATTEG
jgi:hypothetical protein